MGTLDSQPQVIKVYQLFAHGQWFSPGTPASSTTKTGHHDIAEILLKVALNTKNQIKSKEIVMVFMGDQQNNMSPLGHYFKLTPTLKIICKT
jgi:hypothetical protein